MFFKHGEIVINGAKTKVMVVSIAKSKFHQPVVYYEEKVIYLLQTFKYLEVERPSDHTWKGD